MSFSSSCLQNLIFSTGPGFHIFISFPVCRQKPLLSSDCSIRKIRQGASSTTPESSSVCGSAASARTCVQLQLDTLCNSIKARERYITETLTAVFLPGGKRAFHSYAVLSE